MSDNNYAVCRFCERNIKLAYYCEGCGSSCCSDCLIEEKLDYFECQGCQSKNIEIIASSGKKYCTECGGEDIVKISKHLKSCPKCHSQQIINIYEKKEELEQRFLELIKSTRLFIKPFRELITVLNDLRQKTKKARDPPIKCYHYPKMESDLLSLFRLLIYVKSNLLEKISIHFRHLSLNREYFFDIYSQPNSNIRIIEGILENLNRSYNSINEFVEKNIETIKDSIEVLQKNLVFIDKIIDYFISYKRFLNLAEDEKPVYAIKAKLANGLNTQDRFTKNKGILFITSLDISFVHEYGLFKKKKESILKAPVQDLIKIREKGKILKRLYIEFAYGKYEFSLPSKTIPKIIDYILLARNFDEIAVNDLESAQKLQGVDIDLNDLINMIEEGINSFFSLKCQYNNNPRVIFQANQMDYNDHDQNYSYTHYGQNQNSNSLWAKDMNYMRNAERNAPPQAWNPRYEEEDYYYQDTYQSNRPQTYNNQNFYNSRNNPAFDTDERKVLMKKLEKSQKFGQPIPPQRNNIEPNFYDVPPSYKRSQPIFTSNHLSDLFKPNINSDRHQPVVKDNLFTYDRNKRKELLELKRDQFSLKETLKKLDAKFDKGLMSEVDYFRTFKNLQKEIYLIDKKIEAITNSIQETSSIRQMRSERDNQEFYT